MKKHNKKGFTIVELVIVIAVIAILAAVLIPTFSNVIRKAQISADTQVVRNLNTALKTDEATDGKPATMADALAVAADAGYDVAKINATATGNEILWDSVNNVFCYLNDNDVEYIPETEVSSVQNYQRWVIAETVSDTYSTYYVGNDVAELDAVDGLGLDTGNANVDLVKYVGDSANPVIIRTTGGDLQVDAPNADVYHYGEAGFIEIIKVAGSSFHAFGKANYVEIQQGHFVAEATAEIKVVAAAAGVTIDAPADAIEEKHENVADFDEIHQGATLFAGGKGVLSNPYLIEDAEDFKNISEVFEEGYKYFKVKDGVTEIDATDLGRVKFNGAFDGNGVTFKNANGFIFGQAGTGENAVHEGEVIIENINVVFIDGAGIVRNCGAKTLTYKNVNASGYLICDWNAGIFLRYGTANVSDGFDYTINFVNCSSNAKIYSTANAYAAILVGHTYAGTGNTATINVDAATDSQINDTKLCYTGTVSEKNPAFGYKYACIGGKVFVAGVETANEKITGKNIIFVDKTNTLAKQESGEYTIKTADDTAKLIVSLNFQYSLYTDSTYAEVVKDQAGVGGLFATKIELDVPAKSDEKVLDKIESVEIVFGAGKFDYELKDGVLTIYVSTENENIDGTVTLYVEQCTAESNIPTWKDSIVLASKITKNNPEAQWIIK